MLKIRLSRVGRKNLPMFRVVLTEHSKSAKSWYTEVLGSYHPLDHKFTVNADRVAELIKDGVQPSERVAKLMFAQTEDETYKKFYTFRTSTKSVKNPDKYS